MDLLRDAYDDYCDRIEAGEDVDIDRFCDNYPSIRSSLIRQIEIHHYLDDEAFDPSWPDEGEEYLGYKIVEQIGEGAYARVYKCNQSRVANREVVL